ncbi:unnamed protein product [Miscanthus lutarioriparius]|uniref:rRNA adenine N(6)-methyltransferase n=1 Tax=Miscanthus lutarioriparius TaxID=422564 RepID=A0A811NA34_9POAL|nr:unnamed protein product [Miscanthus lutarioriparius]
MNGVVSARRAARHGCRLYSSSASEAWDGPFFRLQKRRGQHLLTNPRVLDAIVRRAVIRPGDAVLEVGPGTGNLTVRLLASPAASVAAVEIDPRMATAVTTGDAMKVDFPEFDVCVSNIPYAISSPLTAKLLFGSYRFRTATLLVQREFARRLVGAPGHGEHNHLATNLRVVADVNLLMDVSKADFVPVPGVDSSLVEIRMKEHQLQQQQKKKKNKKEKNLGTIFKQKEMVMELFRLSRIEEERIGNASSSGRGAPHDEYDADDGENDEHPCNGEGGFSEEEFVVFKERIAGTLQSARLNNERPSMLSNEDMMRLLRLFNKRGVRFH